VGEVGGFLSAKAGWEIFDDVFEGGVGVASAEEFGDVFAEFVLGVFCFGHGDPFWI
jgi:hypothetical protein